MSLHWSAAYIGLPWERLGRARAGLDCWGLCKLVLAERAGVDAPDYGEVPSTHEEREAMSAAIGAIAMAEPWLPVLRPQAFDIAVFRAGRLRRHVGIMIDGRTMLHVPEGGLSRLDAITAPGWARRLVGQFRHMELAR